MTGKDLLKKCRDVLVGFPDLVKEIDEQLEEPQGFRKGQAGYAWDNDVKGRQRRYYSHSVHGQHYCFYNGSTEWNSNGLVTAWDNFTPADDAPITIELTPWNGGKCPIKGQAILMFRSGVIEYIDVAEKLSWGHLGYKSDIIGYLKL